MIINTPCWNCKKEMRMALGQGRDTDDYDYRGPESFSKSEVELAKKHGVFLNVVESKTSEETYLANICPHCKAFIGKWFFFAHYYTPALYGDLEYTIIKE